MCVRMSVCGGGGEDECVPDIPLTLSQLFVG